MFEIFFMNLRWFTPIFNFFKKCGILEMWRILVAKIQKHEKNCNKMFSRLSGYFWLKYMPQIFSIPLKILKSEKLSKSGELLKFSKFGKLLNLVLETRCLLKKDPILLVLPPTLVRTRFSSRLFTIFPPLNRPDHSTARKSIIPENSAWNRNWKQHIGIGARAREAARLSLKSFNFFFKSEIYLDL